MTRWLETDSLSNQDISSALAIGAYTADADRMILVQFFADQVAGNGDYDFYVTLRVNGAGSSYRLIPITTAAAASGLTAIGGQSGMIAVRSGDVVTVYLDGLAGDNSTPDTTVRWFEMAALRPTIADRTLDVSAGGEAGVDWGNVGSPTTTVNLSGTSTKANETAPMDAAGTRAALGMAAADLDTQLDAILEDTGTTLPAQITDIQGRIPAALVDGRIDATANAISGDATAADNLETMLDGTGGAELTLKKLTINNTDPTGVAIQVNAYNAMNVDGTNRGVYLHGGTSQALYMASDYAATTVYIEGPATGGKGISISSPSDGTSLPGASGIYIQTEAGHPAILIDFTDPADAVKVVNSDNGSWVWDDKLFAAATDAADAVRTELAVELAHLDADVSSAGGGLTAQETRDAMKLAPTAGSPAAGSVDAHLDAIQAQTDTIDDIKAVTDALDISAVTQVAASAAGHLTITVARTFDEAVTGLTIPADWVTALWTLKNNARDADTAALVQLRASNPAAGTDGLQRLNGAALVAPITAADGALTVTQATGRIDVWLSDEMTAMLGAATAIGWDVKFIDASGDSSGQRGTADVVLTETKATS